MVKPAEEEAVPSLLITNFVLLEEEAVNISPRPVLFTINADCPPEEELISTFPVPFGVIVSASSAPVVRSVVTPLTVIVEVNVLFVLECYNYSS